MKGETIKIFNYGNCKRDFTYVDDIVEGVVRVMKKAPDKKNGEDGLPIPPYAVYNIGNQNPENLLDFVQILSEEERKFCRKITILKLTRNWFRCSRVMSLSPMQILAHWSVTSGTSRAPA